jgi:hypothetical protein
MQTKQGNMLQSLRNVDVFLDQNATQLAGVVQSDVRQRLTAAIKSLEAQVSAQSEGSFGSMGATQRHQALRRALIRDHMMPIARIAAADLPDTPELRPLRMPASGASVQRLAAAAYGMAETAQKYAEIFTQASLPADFAAQLCTAADAMIASIGDRTKSRLVHRGATEGLKNSLAAGRKIVGVLDALVRSRLQDQPSLVAQWELAKRVTRVSSRAIGGVTPAPVASIALPAA